MKTIAIIPAGGEGKRFKSHIAKQYLLLDGLPVLVHALKPFQESNQIEGIVLALPPEDIISMRQDLIEKYGITKIISVVSGGKERQDSVRNCLDAIGKECDFVMIHDAVRPFLTVDLIQRVLEAASEKGAAICGIRVKDTIKEIKNEEFVLKTIPRDSLWLAQTPQAFNVEILKTAYRNAYAEKFYGTDDASLVERTGHEIIMVQGFHNNIKITTTEDMLIAEAFMGSKKTAGFRSGFGYDSHRLVPERKLILGGVEIPFDKGLHGHSDADALIHAICDALLGAGGAGDIGRHFPDTDPEYKDISSMILLEKVSNLIKKKGFSINNIDVTVVMEMPKLAPYSEQIVSNIAGVLNISGDSVNLKAKTNEGMGFVGRNEGVAVFVTAMLTERKKDAYKA
jgi:2-C-methyl-D-erythritol 4-phosphate cytidylyltransferase/2-C-methyl-D-erythritol 2,4-cyclodiphosphate synthase